MGAASTPYKFIEAAGGNPLGHLDDA